MKDTVWRNWAGNQRCAPVAVEHPGTEAELVGLVKTAAAAGQRVKVVGAGHSFTDIACPGGHLLHLDNYARLLSVDPDAKTVTVQAGIPLTELNRELVQRNLAVPNLGDIAYQSVAGAVSTSTHGTSATIRGLATQVVGLELIAADGSVIVANREEEPDVFAAARVGLGAVGILSTVTLQCVPAFNLHAIEEPMRVDSVLDNLDEHVDGNDHFAFFWVPHTGWAIPTRNKRTAP